MMKQGEMKIGAHVSFGPGGGEGVELAGASAHVLGCEVVQLMLDGAKIFPPKMSCEAMERLKCLMTGRDLYIHMPYTFNMCNDDQKKRKVAQAAFKMYIKIARELEVKALVVHIGYKQKKTIKQALELTCEFLKPLEGMKILLESDAGSKNGSAVGSLEFIRDVVREARKDNVAMCLDTCHVYANGIDIFNDDIRRGVIKDYGRIVEMVHLNVPDLNVRLGSHLDRHNTKFKDSSLNYEPMVIDMMRLWPVVVERRSFSALDADMAYLVGLKKKLLTGTY